MARTYSHRLETGTLAVGFLAFAGAVLAAHGSPAQAYELSIYRATPTAFWVGAGVAMLVAVGVSLSSPDWYRTLALVLGGMTTLSIAALPVLRGYYFHGPGDSLTHLGWAKDIASGELPVYDLLYPGTHTIGVAISEVTGLPLRRSLLVMVAAFVLVYLLFVPLAVHAVTGDERTTTYAALAGFLLLPINAISVFLMPHPTSQAICFLPLLIYLVARYVTRTGERGLPLLGTSSGTLLALASVAILLVHPQQAVNVLMLFCGVVLVQIIYRLFRSGHAIARHRSLIAQTAFLAAAFVAWAPRHERSGGAATALVNRIFEGGPAGANIGQRALSLSELGGSISTLFLKLFLVSVVFFLLASPYMLAGLSGRIRDVDTRAFTSYLTIGLIPLAGLFVAFFVTSYAQFHFRILGFIMVPVTMLGAIALSRLTAAVARRVPNDEPVPMGAAVAFLLLFALSVPTVFLSPYVYQPSAHVSEGEMVGYATAFDQRGDAQFTGLRSSGVRYSDGVLGYEESQSADFRGRGIYGTYNATGENFSAGRIAAELNGSHYLPITDTDRQRELEVYRGLRFPAEGFRTLESSPQVARVQSGGGFGLYYVE